MAVALALIFGAVGLVGYRQLAPHKPAKRSGLPAEVVPVRGVIELEPFVLNLPDAVGDRFLRLTCRLEVDDQELAASASDGLAQAKLRDCVLSVLARKRGSELITVDGRDRLRGEIQSAIQPLFAEAPFHDPASKRAPARVLDVLFTEFLLQ
jgi:flagellar basal body-associated protein FliL